MPTRRSVFTLASGAVVGAATAGVASPASAHDAGPSAWTATWAAPPTTIPPAPPTVLEGQTVRQVVHCSTGGDELRLRLTNEFGDTPLHIGAVHVARRDGDGASTATVAGTDRPVTFGGRGDVVIPPGAPLVSDPVRLRLPAGGDLAISLYLPDRTPVTTLFAFSFQDNVIATGNVTAARTVTATATVQQNTFLSGVAVRKRAGAIVALGDSITNGHNTRANLNHRWPDLLAARLRAIGVDRGVANVGIAGNRLLHDPTTEAVAETFAAYFGQGGLRRFDRDVLSQSGGRYLIVLLGVNDLGHPGTIAPASESVTADDLIAGHRQIIVRAHDAGLAAYGGTILPFKNDTLGFSTPENEVKRQALNRWIRTSGEYDAVIDFDRAMGDPADPLALNPAYDSGDHLHPNEAGMAAMAAAVPLRYLR